MFHLPPLFPSRPLDSCGPLPSSSFPRTKKRHRTVNRPPADRLSEIADRPSADLNLVPNFWEPRFIVLAFPPQSGDFIFTLTPLHLFTLFITKGFYSATRAERPIRRSNQITCHRCEQRYRDLTPPHGSTQLGRKLPSGPWPLQPNISPAAYILLDSI